jgi:hypothetical protein
VSEVAVNFIAFDETLDACLMVLVETAWTGRTDEHLRALQARLYGCLDAALDGQLAAQFPASSGKAVIVRIDCYDVPRDEMDEFMSRFTSGVAALPDYSVDGSPFVREFRFEVNHDTLP